MSKIESEIKKIREDLKSIKDDLKTYINQNKLTDETSKEYVEALINSVREKAIDNPLSIEMWKGYEPNKEEFSKEYLDYWTCDICNEHTHEVDYDYLGNGTNHLGCELKQEDLQKKSDKIMKEVEDNMKNFDLSKSESNENSKVDMSGNKEDK